MSWLQSDEPPSRLRVETRWPECADLDVRALPDVRLPLRSTPVHRIIRTRRRHQGGFVLCGWECTCGECERPRYADPEMAAGAARRHLAAAS